MFEKQREIDFIRTALWESSHAKFVFMRRMKPASLSAVVNSSHLAVSDHDTLAVVRLALW